MKTLSDFDSIYKSTVNQLPIEQRLWYCNRQLDKFQLMLVNNATLLDVELKENLKRMIEVTQGEIKRLEKLMHS